MSLKNEANGAEKTHENTASPEIIALLAKGFDCDACGKHHDTVPLSMAFGFPDFVNKMLPWDREKRAQMSPDWCIVDDKFFYLRGCLEVPIAGAPGRHFVWGVWVTISEDDFDRTMALWNEPARLQEPEYEGTIANTMPSYTDTRNLAVKIRTRAVGDRPAIIVEDSEHKLFGHQQNGVDSQRVIELAKFVLHAGESNPYGYLCEKP